jgi:glycosyltransferase involved in cell wall biosynthesis
MDIKKKISVVVCVKNEEKKIRQCLLSIKKNKIVKEIILVDGNSSDKTVFYSKRFTTKIISSKKKNLTADRQLGIDNCKSDIIAMIDADHILKKNDLLNLYKDLINMNFDMVQSQLQIKNKNFFNSLEQDAWDIVHNFPGERSMIGVAPCIYKKKIFNKIKFDDKITKTIDDTDFIYRLSNLKKFKYGIGQTKITQDHNSSFIDYVKKFLWYGRGDAEFILKHPKKIFSILFHQLIRYPIIYSAKGLISLKLKPVLFFCFQGYFRFFGCIFFFINKFFINKIFIKI